MKKLYLLGALLAYCVVSHAQYVFTPGALPDEVSILDKASIADAGKQEFRFKQIYDGSAGLHFTPMTGRLGNLGFTSSNYWLRFELRNDRDSAIQYYLETAEPVTDNVELYLSDGNGRFEHQRSGDNIAFSKRSVPNRKTMFSVALQPGQTRQAFIELRNDGEKNNLPLKLIKPSRLLEKTYVDQLIMGLFFGILLVIAITYLFFFFALRERSFLYYSMYVVFMALCQFALDGFYHQYFGQDNGWLSRHVVILSAILSCFFFGKYSVTVLEIRRNNPLINRIYDLLFVLLGATLACVVAIPAFLEVSYPVINLLTLGGILLIFVTIVSMAVKRQPIDRFYLGGIVVLFLCIAMAVMMNFGMFPEDFSTDNVTKPGIALEVIALSLSMANRIRLLKTKKEELQFVALQKSEEMNDIKSYFLKNMSHELRTPLNAILGLASTMESESKDPKIRENCEVIRYASHGLISSVNDILDFSRIEKGELRLDRVEFSIQQVFEKLRGAMRKQIEDKGLAFDFSTDVFPGTSVFGDPARLEQMLYNLLGNASKFTASGSVQFHIKSTVNDRRLALEIVIADTGTGIPKDKLDSVFGLFSQSRLDNKRKFGGFGIGLSIVKSLVDLHGGMITLESESDKGTRCTVSLEYDIAEAPVRPVQEQAETEPVYEGKKILIVEDNAMNQMVIKMMLKSLAGLQFAVANDGAECLDKMQSEHFDLILMDLQMPVMDGYEATEAIRAGRAGERYADIPIAVVTADTTLESKDRVFALGVDDYLTKPIDKKLLFEKIDKLLFGKIAVVAQPDKLAV